MDRIKIHLTALLFIIVTMSALLYMGNQVVWSESKTATITPTPSHAMVTAPTIQATPVPTPESGVMKTKYGYYITYPQLGLVTTQSAHVEQLGTPVPGLPADSQNYSHYPRNTILVWSPVLSATSYKLEIEMGDQAGENITWQGSQSYSVRDAWYVFAIDGPRQCRWRVTALDCTGTYARSEPSEWQTLAYTM
jgi:hypothetical protein